MSHHRKLKVELVKIPILKLPGLIKEFQIQTESSGAKVGCVPMQNYEGINHPIAYATRTLLESEGTCSVEETVFRHNVGH